MNKYEINNNGDIIVNGTGIIKVPGLTKAARENGAYKIIDVIMDDEAENLRAFLTIFEVDYTDPETGATSPIDTIRAFDNYTATDYVRDCEENADPEYVEMLKAGTVELIKIV